MAIRGTIARTLVAIGFIAWLLWWFRWLKTSIYELTALLSAMLAVIAKLHSRELRSVIEAISKDDPQLGHHLAELKRLVNPLPKTAVPKTTVTTAAWKGHDFYVYANNANWRDVPGVYIFAGLHQEGEWYPLYIGKTESLSERLPTHEKWSDAQLLGATHIHARVERVRETRVALEKELVAAHLPKLNIDR